MKLLNEFNILFRKIPFAPLLAIYEGGPALAIPRGELLCWNFIVLLKSQISNNFQLPKFENLNIVSFWKVMVTRNAGA